MQPNKPVVLVVDDDPVNLDILVQTLEQDYFLIIAKNGKRALDLAFSHHPDLILLDILMPEMDGFEVCQRLKADKATEGIPVIFLSVMESPGQKHRGFEVGGVDYVTKPFHADEVLARVRTHITNKRLREELESHNMLIGMELHEKSRQLETLMNNLPGLAYQGEHSPDRKVRFVSQGVTRLTGYTPEHFMGPDGMGLLALVHPDDRAHVSETLENALRKKEPFELTYRIITSWNEEKWVWEQGAGVHAGGAGEQAPLLVEGFINDVTERLKELGVEVNGYADLLQPELVGKIASADPASSSSAFCQLTNMLLAMGGYEDDAAWKYVEDLFVGQQVAITSGSSAVYKGVYNGEYAVGLTYEDPCVTLIKDGATNIQVVYPVEGTVFLPAQIGIVKNAKNVENAKAFVDFMLSEDAQRFLAENTTSRNVREVEYKNDVMTPLADIKLIYEDSDYVIAHTSELKEKVQDIMMDM